MCSSEVSFPINPKTEQLQLRAMEEFWNTITRVPKKKAEFVDVLTKVTKLNAEELGAMDVNTLQLIFREMRPVPQEQIFPKGWKKFPKPQLQELFEEYLEPANTDFLKMKVPQLLLEMDMWQKEEMILYSEQQTLMRCTTPPCPRCGIPLMVRRPRERGQKGVFRCLRFPTCDFSMDLDLVTQTKVECDMKKEEMASGSIRRSHRKSPSPSPRRSSASRSSTATRTKTERQLTDTEEMDGSARTRKTRTSGRRESSTGQTGGSSSDVARSYAKVEKDGDISSEELQTDTKKEQMRTARPKKKN